VATCVLFFFASIVGGVINAIAGGGGLITFPLLAGRWASDCRCDKRGGWVRLVSDGSLAYPKSVNRSSGQRWVMASRDPQFSRWIDWSAASESYGQSQLHRVHTMASVTSHYYHCVAPGPGPTKRRRYLAARSRADVMAGRNGGHLRGGAL